MNDQIIDILRNSQSFVSGEEMCKKLKISRAGIWKNIQELRKIGYKIDATPHLGYQLKSSPDKLFPYEIHANLKTKIIGKKIHHHDVLPSTMNEAYRLALEEEAEGSVVCAEGQSKGKGRLGRTWLSPKGKGVYLSMILRPRLSPTDGAKLTLLSAVAVCEAIKNVTNIQASIKWPNDVLVDNKKVAGILTEMSSELDSIRFVIIGVGINVNNQESALPPQATSLKIVLKENVSRVILVQELLQCMDRKYRQLAKEGFAPAMTDWKVLSSTLGRDIRIVDQNGEVQGKLLN